MKLEKKRYWGIAAVGILFFAGYYTLLGLGWLAFFRPQSDNMMPYLKPGTVIGAWKQSQFERYDVVTLYDTCLAIPGHREAKREHYISRIVALEGEELQIKDGRLWINGSPASQPFQTRNHYVIPRKSYDLIQNELPRPADASAYSEAWLALDDAEAEIVRKKVPELRLRDFPLTEHVGIWGEAGKGWSIHEFGPVRIPPGHAFVLCDFRSNAEDSRFRGFVPLEDVQAKVIFP